jgi:hypothetical protein
MTNLLAAGIAAALIELRGDQKRRGEFWTYATDGIATAEDLGHLSGSVIGILLNEIDRYETTATKRRPAKPRRTR